LTALRTNYEEHEPLRQRLINHVPKYGNDDDRVDSLAQEWADCYSELVAQHFNVRGGIYQPGFYTVSAHVPMGANVGATPDGRHAGEPLADGGLSPMAGRDRKGPTAVLRSVSKINLELASNGALLNMKFLPSFFDGQRALEKSSPCCGVSAGSKSLTCYITDTVERRTKWRESFIRVSLCQIWTDPLSFTGTYSAWS
jgi:formate C-acetyltransferase